MKSESGSCAIVMPSEVIALNIFISIVSLKLKSISMLKLMITLMAFFGVSAAAQETKFGDWTVRVTRDKVTLKSEAHAYTYSKSGKTKYGERPFMGINCNSVYFGNVAVLGDEDVTSRFDNQSKANKMNGDRWQGGQGTSIYFQHSLGTSNSDKAFRYYKTYFKDFISAKELYVNFDMYASQTLQVTFSMMGVTASIDRLQSECWVDETGYPLGIILARAHISAINDSKDKNLSDDETEKLLQELERRYGYDSAD